MRLLLVLLLATGTAVAQEKKPAPKKIAVKAHAKATPEQIRKFNQLQEKQKK